METFPKLYNLEDFFNHAISSLLYPQEDEPNKRSFAEIFLFTYRNYGTDTEAFHLYKKKFIAHCEDLQTRSSLVIFLRDWFKLNHKWDSIVNQEFIIQALEFTELHFTNQERALITYMMPNKYRRNTILFSHLGGKAFFAFLEWSPLDIAEQFTLLHSEMFKLIEIGELFEQNWQKEDKESLAPNLTAISNFFNRISYWISSSIILAAKSDSTSPSKVICVFIKVLKKLLKLHNYHIAMAFLSGLTYSSVRRLEEAWKIPDQLLASFRAVEELFNSMENFKHYRKQLAACNGPVLPSLPIFLGGITFLNAGNSNYIADKSINLEKCHLLAKEIGLLYYWQEQVNHYEIKRKEEIIGFLISLQAVAKERLHEISIEIQPNPRKNAQGHNRTPSSPETAFQKHRTFEELMDKVSEAVSKAASLMSYFDKPNEIPSKPLPSPSPNKTHNRFFQRSLSSPEVVATPNKLFKPMASSSALQKNSLEPSPTVITTPVNTTSNDMSTTIDDAQIKIMENPQIDSITSFGQCDLLDEEDFDSELKSRTITNDMERRLIDQLKFVSYQKIPPQVPDYIFLQFIRGQQFKIQKARQKLINYHAWYQKHNLQWPLKIENVKEVLLEGLIQIPNIKDKEGHQIMFMTPNKKEKFNKQTVIQTLVYMLERLADMEDVQRVGYVILVNLTGWKYSSFSKEIMNSAVRTVQDRSPIRLQKCILLNSPPWFRFISGMLARSRSGGVPTVRITLKELFKVMDPNQIPEFLGGTFQFSIQDWIDSRMKLEKNH